jgi:hypothetical protein
MTDSPILTPPLHQVLSFWCPPLFRSGYQAPRRSQPEYEEAGFSVVLVNPAQTLEMCSTCGSIVKKTLSDWINSSLHCGLIMDRELNSSLTIMRLWLQSLANTA